MKRRRWNELSFVERCALRETAEEFRDSAEGRYVKQVLSEKRRAQRKQAERLRAFFAAKRNQQK